MNIHKLLNEPMDRKKFLKYMAYFVLAVGGIANTLRYLSDKNIPLLSSAQKFVEGNMEHYPKQKSGYGSSKYGV